MATARTKASFIGFFSNLFLFIIKIIVGLYIGSIALISDAFNSLMDIVASIATIFSVKVSQQKADTDHPYGHQAAEPIAGLLYAILAGVVGFNFIKESVIRLFQPTVANINWLPFTVIAVTIVLKSMMAIHFKKVGKEHRSPVILASSVDSLNDVIASSFALVAIGISYLGYPIFDGIGGILISFVILKGGYEIARDNIKYLMAHAADEKLLADVVQRTLKVSNVKGVNDLRSHYVGNLFHVEIHIEVDKNLDTKTSHDIGKAVQRELESMNEINKVFVHIDPV
ncbi:MAG: cation diffusion facilitator family transporter [Bacteroidota bacterium]|nr:cation diffusion facilitator family transporter [Bacteroidota bacterium]